MPPLSMDVQQPNQTLVEAAEVISPRILENFMNNNEKQISVDPISLKEPSAYSQLVIPPLPAPPSNKFLSCSLPNSVSSSPKFRAAANLSRNKWRNQSHSVALANLERLRRSKSCGEGRASVPPEEFDMWFAKTNIKQVVGKFSRPETKADGDFRAGAKARSAPLDDEKFKCGALCLFIPGFGKAKPVKARKEELPLPLPAEMVHTISRTVSLEKFECGSWASSSINGGEASTHFFDLPMELIRCKSVNDMHSPVSTAFVFDQKSPKGVLKNGGSSRKSHESTRHVRFSTSSPTSYPASPTSCITPRLRKAREEFNAFLEAQGA
ncbi:PREDICTED: uncharacterized protein LOC109192717 [Ipomoea nil]|uniref:uncharacterized protein LOC109192717 n=1 Tax=Ipomoea nil TaxID=35883 RepID=UPI0009013B23|nr:PREDICTED: uncharacterized protein LOC109192717 [Ipomoea nil]